MARNRVARRSSPSNRAWGGISDLANAIGGSSKVLLGSLTLSNPGIDETMLRVVGVLSVLSDQVAASEVQHGAFGMIVVTDTALAAGAASIPGPVTDIADDGWFVHVPFVNQFSLLSSVGFEGNSSTSRYFDFKSKRIVHDGQSIAIMVENIGGTGFTFNTILRVLSMVRGT